MLDNVLEFANSLNEFYAGFGIFDFQKEQEELVKLLKMKGEPRIVLTEKEVDITLK